MLHHVTSDGKVGDGRRNDDASGESENEGVRPILKCPFRSAAVALESGFTPISASRIDKIDAIIRAEYIPCFLSI
jgi:hypothetical protein